MEQTLDWYLTNFSSKYKEKIKNKNTYLPSESPVFLVDFGSITTQWKVELYECEVDDDEDNYWNFWLNLLSIEIKPEVHVPIEIQERILSTTAQITVQCQLILMAPRGEMGKNWCTELLELSFGPELPPGGKWEALGFPPYPAANDEDDDEEEDIKSLEKWVDPSNDTLHVRVTLKCINSAPPMTLYPQGPNTHLINDLGGILGSGQNSDVVIKCGQGQDLVSFPVHKFILSLRSPVFNAMLNSDMVEAASGVISIEDTDPPIMKQFLNFLYTGKSEFKNMSQETVIGLIAVGDKYQVTAFKDVCFQHLLDNLSEDSCGQLAVAAYLHGADPWQKNLIYEYIAEHWRTLGGQNEFQELVKKYPAAFLKP